ncbi:MAG: NADH-quinone oxidoreductase subunit, partial [Actinomycetota bacterium]|nr:NADH-quinone oxidoreductase subunit [Actinomycetota bacterium]
MAFPYATALLAVPAAGAVATAAIPASKEKAVRSFSIGVSLVALVLSAAMLVDFDKGVAGYQFVESKVWIKPLGIHYLMGVDGISLFMIVLTGLLFPIAMLASTHISKRVNAYFALMLALEAALMGIFLSVDLFLFFVFWEAMLVPMYFLIGVWGYDRRVYAALKFFIYTAAGSALLLLGILSLAVLHAKAPGANLTFDLRTLMAWKGLDPNTARWLFLAFGASFAIKVP